MSPKLNKGIINVMLGFWTKRSLYWVKSAFEFKTLDIKHQYIYVTT